jgi:hypothetical protein
MNSITTLYNSLPDVEEADDKFVNRAPIFSKLAQLLTEYDYKFGVCLVHGHCKLEEGEVMIADGLVSQPQRAETFYPERWLASGTPYEFNKEPTVSPPPELFERFRRIVDGIDVLGLYYAGKMEPSKIYKERTEGRANLATLTTEVGQDNIQTGWLPGKIQPVTTCTG